MEHSNNNSRQDTIKSCEVLEKREITAIMKGSLENGVLEDGKIKKERDIEKGISGEVSNVHSGHEVRPGLLYFGTVESLV